MADSEVVRVARGGKRKFQDGARVKGKEEGAASFRGRTGTVIGYVGWSRQYKISFDDGQIEYPFVHWLESA